MAMVLIVCEINLPVLLSDSLHSTLYLRSPITPASKLKYDCQSRVGLVEENTTSLTCENCDRCVRLVDDFTMINSTWAKYDRLDRSTRSIDSDQLRSIFGNLPAQFVDLPRRTYRLSFISFIYNSLGNEVPMATK